MSNFHIESKREAQIVYMIIAIIAFVEGLQVLARLAYQYYFKDDLLLSPAEVSLILGIIYIPWCIKPLFAYICDTYHFLGYRRKSYLIFWAIIESLLWILLGSHFVDDAPKTVVVLFGLKVAVSFSNVVGQALVVEISKIQTAINTKGMSESDRQKGTNEEASSNVSLFLGLKMMGIMISSYFGGYLLEFMPKKQIFLMTGLIPVILIIFAFFLPERRLAKKASQDQEDQPLTADPEEDEQKKLEDNNFKKFLNFIKQKEILYPVGFLFLFAAAPSSEGVMFFFFTNHLHFSAIFMGQIKVVSTLGNLIAIWIFHKYLRDIKFKTIFFWSAMVAILVYESQIILLERWNLQLGIPDKLFALFDSFVIHLLKEINLLPILVLGCKICPKNIEATMYAFITTVLNCGNLMSLYTESLCAYYLRITSFNFENLTTLVIICGLSHAIIAMFVYQVDFNDNLTEEQLEQLANKGIPSDNNKPAPANQS